MKQVSVNIEINSEALQGFIKSNGSSASRIDKELGFSNDYTRRCIQRGKIDEDRFKKILGNYREDWEYSDIQTNYDLTEIPSWQLEREIERRGLRG